MIFKATDLAGAYVIEPERIEDERGFFARTFCAREFQAHGLNAHFVQCSTSFNKVKGTLRGMHHQAAPCEEAKLIRCTRGSIFDVIIDLRPQAATFKRHVSVELSAANRLMLYVPEGCAHGFQALEDDTEVFYQMSEFFSPDCARGIRWNDPAFRIQWPEDVRTISRRDQQYPDFNP